MTLSRKLLFLAWPALACCLIGHGACRLPTFVSGPSPLSGIKKVVVMGFGPALSEGEAADVVRSPLTGAVFMATPVPDAVVQEMTWSLFENLKEKEAFELVPPGRARRKMAGLLGSDGRVERMPVESFQAVGKAFGADAVLAGYLYRWKERKGTQFAVEAPASVAFDLHFIRPEDGAILWRGRFDKTQQSLSENLLDAGAFFRGGGRWMSAEQLALLGLRDLITEVTGDRNRDRGEGEQ